MFAIRNVGQNEISRVLELAKAADMELELTQLTKQLVLEHTARCMLMECDGDAGFCLWDDGEETMHIRMAYIRPDLRRQGLGKLLFENIARIAEMEHAAWLTWDAAFGDKWAAGKCFLEDGLVKVSGADIPSLWGHCNCHK